MGEFLKEITQMDNEEPREGVVVKAPFKNPVLAVEVEDSGKLSQREEEMAQEIEKLKRLNELEGPVVKPRPELGKSCRSRGNIKCFRYGKSGQIAYECQGGRKQSDDPEVEQDLQGKRQAKESQGKAGRARWGGF